MTTCFSPPQVSHLQELVREGQQNLGSAQTQISCLKETQEKLKIELDATRARVRETSNLVTDLQVRGNLKEQETGWEVFLVSSQSGVSITESDK